MQSVQRKKHVPGQYQSGNRIPADGVSGQRIITRHVRMNYLNIVFVDHCREKPGAVYIQRISQRQHRNIFFCNFAELIVQTRVMPQRDENFVAAFDQTIGKISQVTLAAAKRLR